MPKQKNTSTTTDTPNNVDSNTGYPLASPAETSGDDISSYVGGTIGIVQEQNAHFEQRFDLVNGDYLDGYQLAYETLDFSKIPNCQDNLLSIFSDQTLFYPQGNFKVLLETSYYSTAHGMTTLVKNKEDLVLSNTTKLTEEIEIILDEALDCRVVTLRNVTGKTIQKYFDIERFVEWIATIPPNQLMQCSPSVRGIFTAFQYARKLALQSAYIPQLVELDKRWYAVRWIPAYLNEEIKAVHAEISPCSCAQQAIAGQCNREKRPEVSASCG